MGAVNVGAVLTTWTSLSHRSRVVLVAMAHVALDAPRDGAPARRYFGGPGYLAEVLYGPDGVERNEGGEIVATASAGRQVEKVLTELVRAGAVRRVRAGGRRHRSEYEVVLTPPVSPTETVGPSPTESVGTARPNRSVQPDQNGRPQENRGTTEENQEDNPGSGEHVESRGTTASDGHKIESTGKVWHDVPLLPDSDVPLTGIPDLAAAYPDAWAHLERQMGHARAGTAVAALLDVGYESHTEAVIRAALVSGWTP